MNGARAWIEARELGIPPNSDEEETIIQDLINEGSTSTDAAAASFTLDDFDSWGTIFPDILADVNKIDDPFSRVQALGDFSNQVFEQWKEDNSESTVIERTRALDTIKSTIENGVIPNTRAFNYAGMPLSKAVNAWYDGNQEIRDSILRAGLDLNPQPFIIGEDGEQLFVRVVPQGDIGVHNMVQNATGAKYLAIQVGTMSDDPEQTGTPAGRDHRGLGSNILSGSVSTAPAREGRVFTEIGSRANAKLLLRDNWENLPDYLQQHIAVQFSQGYLPLLEELSKKHGVEDDDLFNARFKSYMHKKDTGGGYEYPGTGDEQAQNEIRFAADVFIKSIGVPGVDKQDAEWKSGRTGPIMHTIGLEVYNKLIGTNDEERLAFLNRLREATPTAGNTEPFSLLSPAEAAEVSLETAETDLDQTSLLREDTNNYDSIWEISSAYEGTGYSVIGKEGEEFNNSGLTLKTYQAIQKNEGNPIPDVDDLKELSTDQVKEIIRKEFYLKPKLGTLPAGLQGIVFDHGLMRGSTNAIKLLQEVIGLTGVDGIIGESTLETIEDINLPQLIERYRQARIEEFKDLIKNNERLKQYEDGWLDRASTYPNPGK